MREEPLCPIASVPPCSSFQVTIRTWTCEADSRLRRQDGAYGWFLFRANPPRDEKGNIVSWYGINTDIARCELEHMARVATLAR
jgi:PAS domain-containing protein